jgi:23S rRNA (cytosine1962-C5)-methyltransferase
MAEVQLKAGRDKSLLNHHPWVFSGSVEVVRGEPSDGETVRISNASGEFIAWGSYSSKSQIRIRALSWNQAGNIGPDFFRLRLQQAIARRKAVIPDSRGNAARLVHGESDGLPGLIVDRYGDTLVMQCLSCGAEYWRELLADILMEISEAATLYERSDADVRQLEGLLPRTGLVRGRELEEAIIIQEYGLHFWVDVRRGHKTGFYLDQAENRLRVQSLARDRSVLDCFSYTGGFAAHALAGGARSIVLVDESLNALQLAEKNLAQNGLLSTEVSFLEGNAFQLLRKFRDRGQKFDLIVLDPPKFAPTAALAESASRGYKDINLLALKLLNPKGLLVTFSCSGGISAELFQKIIAGAALDAGVDARIAGHLHQGGDHPIGLAYPEGEYLKGLVIQVD